MNGDNAMHHRTRTAIVATIALIAALACVPPTSAHEGADEHDYRDHDIEETFTLPGFGFAELNLEAEAGESIAWTVTTDANTPPYVDVHTHNATGTHQFFTENNDTSIESTFSVPEDGTYSIYIRNEQAAPAETTLTAHGRFAVISTEGFTLDVEADSPALPLFIALTGLAVLAVAVSYARRR